MKWLLIAVGGIALLAVIVLIIGLLRSPSHVASVSASLAVAPDSVWRIISDVEAQPDWVPDVRSVERLADNQGRPAYRENFGGFEAMTVITESSPPRKLVKEILPTGPFYGTWTWELAPEDGGTRLTITERGTVSNPFLRGMMIFANPRKTMEEYVRALRVRLGTG